MSFLDSATSKYSKTVKLSWHSKNFVFVDQSYHCIQVLQQQTFAISFQFVLSLWKSRFLVVGSVSMLCRKTLLTTYARIMQFLGLFHSKGFSGPGKSLIMTE